MDIKELQSCLQREVLIKEPMKDHTTWKIGGPADCFIEPATVDELIHALTVINREKLPFIVIGNGSNILVSDLGIRGVVIKLGENYSSVAWSEYEAEAYAGASFSGLAFQAAERSLGGLEFVAGIPGTIAGAVIMNAGAYESSVGRYVTKISVVEYTGTKRIISADEISFSYRQSNIFTLPVIICSVFIKLGKGNREDSLKTMHQLLRIRSEKQPLDYPSCGSVFRNPANDHAGRLIEAAGLRGESVGGAMISEKHGNFIINYNNAKAQDVLTLIAKAQEKVYELFGIKLETEVKKAGQFS